MLEIPCTVIQKITTSLNSHIRNTKPLGSFIGQSSRDLNYTNSQFINITNGTEMMNQIILVAVTIWKIHRITLFTRYNSIHNFYS